MGLRDRLPNSDERNRWLTRYLGSITAAGCHMVLGGLHSSGNAFQRLPDR